MLLLVFMSLLSELCLIKGEQTKVTVKEGGNVTLPCNVDTKRLLKDLKVVWEHGDPGEKIVFTFMNDDSYHGTQNPQFQGRVSFFEEEIKKGNASIQLTNVTQTDAGIYTCLVSYHDLPDPKKESSVHLVVLKGGKQRKNTGPDTTTKTTMKPPETQTNNQTNWIIVGVGVLVAFIIVSVMFWKRQDLIGCWMITVERLADHHDRQPDEGTVQIEMGEQDPNPNEALNLPGRQEPDRDEGERDNNDPDAGEDSPLRGNRKCTKTLQERGADGDAGEPGPERPRSLQRSDSNVSKLRKRTSPPSSSTSSDAQSLGKTGLQVSTEHNFC